jgi:methionyl-tRNA synthetase
MPNKAQQVWAQLGGPGNVADQRMSTLDRLDPTGWKVSKGDVLFPRPTNEKPA